MSGVATRRILFALKNNGVITDAEFEDLDKSWMKYKTKCGLDACGQKTERHEKKAPSQPQVGLRDS